jgi:hypothetical protein
MFFDLCVCVEVGVSTKKRQKKIQLREQKVSRLSLILLGPSESYPTRFSARTAKQWYVVVHCCMALVLNSKRIDARCQATKWRRHGFQSATVETFRVPTVFDSIHRSAYGSLQRTHCLQGSTLLRTAQGRRVVARDAPSQVRCSFLCASPLAGRQR